MSIHLAKKAKITLLIVEEVKILIDYLDFSDVFLKKRALVLPKISDLNQHAIDLQKGEQLCYRPIYSLGSVKLETLKTYIETNLANSFIRPLKLLTNASILFAGKQDGSLRLCVNY